MNFKKLITGILLTLLLSVSVYALNVIDTSDTNTVIAPSRNGLIGYWTMDSNDVNGITYYDKSGRGQNLTANNSPTQLTGKIKEVVCFDNSSENLLGSGFNLSGNVDYSISLWFKADSFDNASNGLTRIGGASVQQSIALYLDNSGIIHGGLWSRDLNTGVTAEVGQWYNIIQTYNSSEGINGTTRVYVDGQLEVTNTSSTLQPNFTGTNILIGQSSGTTNNFQGCIDEFRLYSTTLSTSQVNNIYNATKITNISAPTRTGLVLYYTMDSNDINGTTLYDKSGKGYNGTLVNAPTTGTGIINQCLNLDTSSNQSVTLPTAIGTDITSTNAFTFTTRVKFDSFVANAGVIGIGLTGERSLWIYTDDADGITIFSNTDTLGGSALLDGLSTDTWYFLVVRGDTSNNFVSEIYNESGTLVDSFTDSGYTGNINSVSVAHLGLIQGFNEMDGCTDDTRLYNRYLTDTEISNLKRSK